MVQINRLRTLIFSLSLLFALSSMAVNFRFDPKSVDARAPKTTMERNISALLTEIDRAGRAGANLNLAGISMEPKAKERLMALWEDSKFVCDQQENIKKCLNDFQGYQVRGILITMKPSDSTYPGSLNRELTISLNKSGIITGVKPAWESQEGVDMILKSSNGVADTRQRLEILKWVEDFRCYYNEKNLNALEQIYSDDALIITGSVTTSRKRQGDMGVHLYSHVKYDVQNKTQYMNKLTRIFHNNRRINVQFDHINVMRHGAPGKEHIYGVTLHQKWQTSTYSDEGWLFLLWDFGDPEHPQIHVRTWQPEQVVSSDGVFSLDDFFIP